MYLILYNIFFSLKRIERKKQNERFAIFCKKYYDLFDLYLNVVFVKLITIFKSSRSGITKKKRKQKVVVSLTSFPARIEKVWVTIETIFRQSVKADEVILWLADSQFDGFDSLPESLKSLCNRGLTIRFCDDLRSHKKYYYTFKDYGDDLVILMDDDTFYPKDVIKKLMRLHKKYPDDIISMLSQQVPDDLTILPSDWTYIHTFKPHSNRVQPFTGQGTLYQPNKFDHILFNKELLLKLTPYADDLWVYMIGLISGLRITVEWPRRSFSKIIWGTGESALLNKNTGEGESYNDVQWASLIEYFKDRICLREGNI